MGTCSFDLTKKMETGDLEAMWTDDRIVCGSRLVNLGCPEALTEAPSTQLLQSLETRQQLLHLKI